MTSYVLFLLMSVLSALGLCSKDTARAEWLCRTNRLVLTPAVFLLAAGIFIGAYGQTSHGDAIGVGTLRRHVPLSCSWFIPSRCTGAHAVWPVSVVLVCCMSICSWRWSRSFSHISARTICSPVLTLTHDRGSEPFPVVCYTIREYAGICESALTAASEGRPSPSLWYARCFGRIDGCQAPNMVAGTSTCSTGIAATRNTAPGLGRYPRLLSRRRVAHKE